MKRLLLLAICFLYPAVKGFNDLPRIEKVVEFKCNQSGENALHELQMSLRDFQINIRSLVPQREPTFEDFQQLCTPPTRSNLYESFLIVVEKIEPCLAKQEQYAKKFLPLLFNYTMDQFCQRDEYDTMTELLNYAFACLPGLSDFHDKCWSQMTLYDNIRAEKYFWEKKDLCRDVKFLQKCAKTVIQCKFVISEGVKLATKSFSRVCNL